MPFEEGERKLGANVTTAYYAQYQLELLNPENTVLEEIRQVARMNRNKIYAGFWELFFSAAMMLLKR